MNNFFDFKKIKFIILILLIILIIFLTRYFGLTQYFKPEFLRETISGFGVLAPVIYILIYALATILFLPGSPLTIAGGLIFGVGFGTLYTVIGATLGASVAFLVARYFGGKLIEGFLKKHNFKKLEEYHDKLESNGFSAVIFLRLIPLFPFNGLNFALGLTKVKFRSYLIATLIGIIPGTFVFNYFGDSLGNLSFMNIVISLILIILLISSLPIYNKLKVISNRRKIKKAMRKK